MPNKNYIKGVKKERRIKKELEAAGLTVIRSAGSFGFADLVAIDFENNKIRFIQCKPDNFPASEEKKLMEEHDMFNSPYMAWKSSFEVI